MANTTNTTNTTGGNGGLYFIVGAITIAVILIIAILTGAINITGPSGGGPGKKLDITIEQPKTPAPSPTK